MITQQRTHTQKKKRQLAHQGPPPIARHWNYQTHTHLNTLAGPYACSSKVRVHVICSCLYLFYSFLSARVRAHKRGVYVGDARGARVCATLCGTGDKRGVNSFAPIAHLRQLCVCHRARVSSALAKLYCLHICVRCVKTPTSMFCNVVHRHTHTRERTGDHIYGALASLH